LIISSRDCGEHEKDNNGQHTSERDNNAIKFEIQ